MLQNIYVTIATLTVLENIFLSLIKHLVPITKYKVVISMVQHYITALLHLAKITLYYLDS